MGVNQRMRLCPRPHFASATHTHAHRCLLPGGTIRNPSMRRGLVGPVLGRKALPKCHVLSFSGLRPLSAPLLDSQPSLPFVLSALITLAQAWPSSKFTSRFASVSSAYPAQIRALNRNNTASIKHSHHPSLWPWLSWAFTDLHSKWKRTESTFLHPRC